jgi:hypothetical protein
MTQSMRGTVPEGDEMHAVDEDVRSPWQHPNFGKVVIVTATALVT